MERLAWDWERGVVPAGWSEQDWDNNMNTILLPVCSMLHTQHTCVFVGLPLWTHFCD